MASKIRLFADDCLLYAAIKSPEDIETIQSDLNNINKWCNEWQMVLNYDKCEVMHINDGKDMVHHDFKLGSHTLLYTDYYKYLGVYINKNLKWDKHIDEIVKKGKRTLYVVRKVLRKAPKNIKQLAYFSLVRPTVEYASSVWDPSNVGEIHKLEMIQRASARFCTNRYKRIDSATGKVDSVTDMLQSLEWNSLASRRKANRLALFSAVYTSNQALTDLSAQLCPANYQGRHDHDKKVAEIRCNKNVYHYSFLPKSIREWNTLPTDTFVDLESSDTSKMREKLLRILQ